MSCFVPGKVFLIGEYACLFDSPAILLTLNPCYEARLVLSESSKHPFHNESPAGKLLSNKNFGLVQWVDPYEKEMGFGSSTAQFLSTYAFLNSRVDPKEVHEKYLSLFDQNELKPSGLDLIAQTVGGPVLCRKNPFQFEKLNDFQNSTLEIALAFTGTKIKTHQHLSQATNLLEKIKPRLDGFESLVTKTRDAWIKKDLASIGSYLTQYQNTLNSAGIVPELTQKQIETLQRTPGVIGVKGSGSQGGDCVILVMEKHNKDSVQKTCRELNWHLLSPEWTTDGYSIQRA